MGCFSRQSLSARVVVSIVPLLLPESPGVNRFRMRAGLPEAVFAVLPSRVPERTGKTGWHMRDAIVGELSPRVLAQVCQCLPQTVGIKVLVEQNGVEMSGHNHIGVGP